MLNPIALARKAIEIGGIIPDDKEEHSLRESATNIGSRAIFYKRRLRNRGLYEAAVSWAIEAGATIEGETQTHNWGRIAHMADPFGHGICFIQFLGRGYDEISHE